MIYILYFVMQWYLYLCNQPYLSIFSCKRVKDLLVYYQASFPDLHQLFHCCEVLNFKLRAYFLVSSNGRYCLLVNAIDPVPSQSPQPCHCSLYVLSGRAGISFGFWPVLHQFQGYSDIPDIDE
jgi:hypothetical protein